MTVAELKAALSGLGLAVKGTKPVLVARMEEAQASAAGLTTGTQAPLGVALCLCTGLITCLFIPLKIGRVA